MLDRIGWIVDVQKDFMDEDGALYVKDLFNDNDPGAEVIKEKLSVAVKILDVECDLLVYTADCHRMSDREISTNPVPALGTYPPHCMEGTEGAELIPEVVLDDNFHLLGRDASTTDGVSLGHQIIDLARYGKASRVLIQKYEFDVFKGNVGASAFLHEVADEKTEIIVCGVATDVCVKHAIDGMVERGFNVTAMPQAMYGLGLTTVSALMKDWQAKGVTFWLPLLTPEYD